jgi:hypothetical protein
MVRNLRSLGDWRILVGSLKRWPYFAARGFKTYIKHVVKATSLMFKKQKRLATSKAIPVNPAIVTQAHVDLNGKSRS